MRVKGGNHSTFFMYWCDPSTEKRVAFDPKLDENHFMAIGGCQGGHLIVPGVYGIRKSQNYKGIQWCPVIHDGYGAVGGL